MDTIPLIIIIVGVIFLVLALYLISVRDKNLQQQRDQLQLRIDNLAKLDGFNVEKVNKTISFALVLDDTNKQFALVLANAESPLIYSFSKLIDFEVIENGSQIIKGTSGNAAIGGLLFGVAGAIIGSSGKKQINDMCSELTLQVFLDDIKNTQFPIVFIRGAVQKNSLVYTKACEALKEIVASLTYIINKNSEKKNSKNVSNDVADQIKKLSELKEQGILTQEEFEAKKKQLLNL